MHSRGMRFRTARRNITTSTPFKLDTQRMNRYSPGHTKRHIQEVPVMDLLLQFHDCRCQDVRDRVFGLLSLSQECCRAIITADYSAHCKDVCSELIAHHLACHNESNGTRSLPICRQILRSLGMETRPDVESHASCLDRSLRSLKMAGKS